jgi:hypothetical protein
MYTRELEDAIFRCSEILQKMFHKDTLLLGAETPVKLLRMAIATASILYSTDPNDYNRIMPTAEHVEYVMNFLIRIYSSEELNLLETSNHIKRASVLGNVEFMRNIMKYVGVDQLFSEQSLTKDSISSIFSDYTTRVTQGLMRIPDSRSDDRYQVGIPTYDVEKKLINLLVARNFLKRSKYSYRISAAAYAWLKAFNKEPEETRCNDDLEVRAGKQSGGADSEASRYKDALQPVRTYIKC